MYLRVLSVRHHGSCYVRLEQELHCALLLPVLVVVHCVEEYSSFQLWVLPLRVVPVLYAAHHVLPYVVPFFHVRVASDVLFLLRIRNLIQ